jgi:prepilin-type N-terminal cleavage/methylation domain-containing protein
MLHFSKHKKGFTLIELLVTISIMLIILGVLVSNEGQYSDAAALKNLGDTIGLTLRQAQIYGISVKELSTGSNNFTSAYGVDFNITGSGSNSAYISFADLAPQNSIYDGSWSCPIGGGSECLSKTIITGGDTIKSLCEIPLSGSANCSMGRVDVTFLRPEINAQMKFFDLSGNPLALSGIKGAQINLLSPAGSTRSVTIYTTGQISVE